MNVGSIVPLPKTEISHSEGESAVLEGKKKKKKHKKKGKVLVIKL
jgi:hypothetical protein